MEKIIRPTVLLLALTMLCSACGTVAENHPDIPGTTDSTQPTTTDDPLKDAIPDDLNYSGREFRIFSRLQPWFNGNWTVEEETGELLNDAIYKRQGRVMDRFGITITETGSDKTDQARNSILAGDNSFDIVNMRCSTAFEYAAERLFYSTDNLRYADLSRPYWDAQLNECVSICGMSYFPIGASNLTSYDYTHVLVFNKKLAEEKKIDDLYSLVRSGKWTLDTYASVVKDFSQDLNGDSVMDESDLYGYLSQPKAVLPGFWIASGVLSVNVNSDGKPEFTMPSDQKFLEIFEKSFAITYDNSSWFKNTAVANYDTLLTTMFQNDKGLLMDMTFFYISSLRDMDANFGIIPYPKYDEAQENYLSRIEGCELTGVPVTADPEFVSVVLEALASDSAKNVVPAYYDVALKTKYTRDEESAEMLDVIFQNRVFDLGDTIWCDQIRDGVFKPMFTDDDRALSSKFASMQNVMEERISQAVEAFRAD